MRPLLFILLPALFLGCNEDSFEEKKTNAKLLFTNVEAKHSSVDFANTIIQNDDFNCIRYTYALAGAGVAVGDVNNDGLQDVYFVANQKSNKLYLNKGDFKFEDITDSALVTDTKGWSTGVSMIDINNDGWLDIYICKSASLNTNEARKNLLFVNQKDGTFKEEANAWGIDHNGFSMQSYFFDYDKDGDLDIYLVNHRVDFENTLRLESRTKQKFFPETSDQLFRNDGRRFTNVTASSKIINSAWGLSASIGDFNNDTWPDIYVANDYIAPDMLYINNKDGTFSNQINTRFQHISYNSMGSDFADINNDFLPDLMVLEMSAEDHIRSKENMPTMNTEGFNKIVNAGYHKPYMANVLQLNNGNGSFSDIGQMAGISKTDWSWAPIIADFDNDGFKDVFITNGIERNFSNQDYAKKVKENLDNGIEMSVLEVIEMMPSDKISNYSYRNNGNLSFENTTTKWGLNEKVNSNGVAYADLDNDGDLDLVLNNLSDTASIYENNAIGSYLNIKLEGGKKNKMAIGAKVKVYTGKNKQMQELYTSRGYLSSVSNVLNFGFGDFQTIDRIEVVWPSGTITVLEDVPANQTLTIAYKPKNSGISLKNEVNRNLVPINPKALGINYEHKEKNFNDFSKQVLLPQKLSQQGPAISVADINNDGLQDLFLGGGKGQEGEIYLQKSDGVFTRLSQPVLEKDKLFEDIESIFFDADNDGDLDLYVVSGGYELSENSSLLRDRLYSNNGDGIFDNRNHITENSTNTKIVVAEDFDNDGDKDLFIGGYTKPGKYPLFEKSYILTNDNGVFTDATHTVAPSFSDVGLVNDILFSDYDGDGDKDLWVVGEWIPITLFKNTNGKFEKTNVTSLNNTSGWWNCIKAIDLDNDGDDDYILGNLGKNNKFHPTAEKPLHIYGNNFDNNTTYDMVLSKAYKGNLVPIRGKECSTEQNIFIKNKIITFSDFANATLEDIYGKKALESSYHQQVVTFSSVYLINNGNGNFEVHELPNQAQIGPTLDFQITDSNKDGIKDIIGIGALHETEVETIPYNGNTGYILLGSKTGTLLPYKDINFYNNSNAKRVRSITINNSSYYIVLNNNAKLKIFKNK